MLKRRLTFLFLLLAFTVVSAAAPSLALACPHMKKAEQESTMDSDCPMHKKLEEKKSDTQDKSCCNSASCKVPQTSFLSSGQLSTPFIYNVAAYNALDDAFIAFRGPDLVTPPPKSNLA